MALRKCLDEETYISNLSRSLSLVLDDFYSTLRAVGFSSVTGEGVAELLKEVADGRKEYFEDFLPDLVAKRKRAREREERKKKEDLQKLKDDLVSYTYLLLPIEMAHFLK